ncbi:MAG: hypothetical protein H8F28_23675 [Fibrella sp.]|nr:hypothetical protein [Armatimonadota bacterium]
MELSASEQDESTLPVKPPSAQMKRNFSGLSLKEAMRYTGQTDFLSWEIKAEPRPPSAFLSEALRRFDSFSLTNSEAAKLLLIDILLTETMPQFPRLRVWKGEPLESVTLTGIADYLLAPKRAFVETPLLCAVEAKRDDFAQGRAQCVAEMAACRGVNEADGHRIDVYGVVSNGQGWEFYRLAHAGGVYVTELYTMKFLPQLLAALHHVCAACERNIP